MTDAPLIPDFSPGLALGLALSILPRPVLQYVTHTLTHRLNSHYPALKERLSEAEGKIFALEISDMPFNILLGIKQGQVALEITAKQTLLHADVRLNGSSGTFLELLEGKSDGDALFFSRKLSVEGDTEAVLVLRNALDNAPIDLHDLVFSLFGPFSSFVAQAATPMERLAMRFTHDMRWLYHSVTAPLARQQQQFAQNLHDAERRLTRLENNAAKQQVRNARSA